MNELSGREAPRVRLIASDLDGTLLDERGTLPYANIEAARRASERGVIVAVATGRMFPSAKIFASKLGSTAPIICYNGAMIRRPGGEVIFHKELPIALASECLALCRERGVYVQSYVGDTLYVESASADEARFYMEHYGITGVPIGGALYTPSEAPTKLLMMTSGLDETHELIELFSGRFGDALYVTSSDAIFVELMAPGAGKARALRALASELGVPMEEVMALGDGENDAEMLAAAGLGVAMARARDAAKAAADVIAPEGEEGFAWAVERYILS